MRCFPKVISNVSSKSCRSHGKPCGPIQPIGLCHSCLYRFVALIPLAGRDRSAGTRAKTTAQTCETQEEIEELRLYYNMQMNDVLAQMKKLYKQDRTPGAEELLQESKRILTDNYMFEETILPTLPCSNDGLFAMTQHYSNSLEGLTLMLKQMEQVTDNQK